MALQEDLRTQGDFLFRYRSYLPLGLVVVGLCVKVYQERFNGPASEGLISESLEAIALAVGLISFTVFGIEAIGIEIENPFGCDPNDLPLEAICQTMQRNIEDLITLTPDNCHWREDATPSVSTACP